MPSELIVQMLTSYSSFGAVMKLSTVCKAFSKFSSALCEGNEDCYQKLCLARAMLAIEEPLNFEVRFHPSRGMNMLLQLAGAECGPGTSLDDKLVKAGALRSLAFSQLTTISCTREYTMDCRLKGVKLLGDAFECAKSEGGDCPDALKEASVSCGREISELYESGKYGVQADLEMSSEWMRKCAEVGDVESMMDYATCLELGHGIRGGPEEEEAFRWFLKAGEESGRRFRDGESKGYDGEACYCIGEYYEFGKGGLTPNHYMAVLWYSRGASNDDNDCQRGLKRLDEIASIAGPAAASSSVTVLGKRDAGRDRAQ